MSNKYAACKPWITTHVKNVLNNKSTNAFNENKTIIAQIQNIRWSPAHKNNVKPSLTPPNTFSSDIFTTIPKFVNGCNNEIEISDGLNKFKMYIKSCMLPQRARCIYSVNKVIKLQQFTTEFDEHTGRVYLLVDRYCL